jgi:hypothetical protein
MKTVEFNTKYRDKIVSGSYTVTFRTTEGENWPARIICWDRKPVEEECCGKPVISLVTNPKTGIEFIVESDNDSSFSFGSHHGRLQVTYQDLPSKLMRVKYAIANSDSFAEHLMETYGYDRGGTEAKSWYDQKIDFINKNSKEHMNSLYLRLKENGHWEYDDADEWKGLHGFKVGDLVICKRVSAPWMLKVGNTYAITNIKNDVLYVDAGVFGELSFNKYDFVDTFTINKQEEEKAEQPKATFDFSTLKPFEKVLVRHRHSPWKPAFFSMYRKECEIAPFSVIGSDYCYDGPSYKECIPYIGNEYLLGTTDPAPVFYGFKD